jgi:hypothetical protein
MELPRLPPKRGPSRGAVPLVGALPRRLRPCVHRLLRTVGGTEKRTGLYQLPVLEKTKAQTAAIVPVRNLQGTVWRVRFWFTPLRWRIRYQARRPAEIRFFAGGRK